MKDIKILHLFPKLLSLYGEYANLTVLKSELEKKGYFCEIAYYENGDLAFDNFDFIYIGSGTEDNIIEALKRLIPYRDAILSSIESEALWLATGNAMALFGKTITRNGEKSKALGIFTYNTEINDEKRYLGDVLTKDGKVGFINTSCVFEGMKPHIFELILNESLGNDKKSSYEGFREKNFYATQLIGPVIAKNPSFLEEIASKITGESFTLPADCTINKAYAVSYEELKKRLSQQ